MNLTSITQVKELLKENNLHPKKRFGQNFLIDKNMVNKIIGAVNPQPDDNILEIGPGLGVLTYDLALSGANVVCVEADKDFEVILTQTLTNLNNARIIIDDFLKIELDSLLNSADGKWKVVGNLPYYITTPIIAKLLDHKDKVSEIVLMVQKEVAQRMQAEPDTDDYGALSIFVQYYCRIFNIVKVSRNVFFPAPDVDSQVIKLEVLNSPAVDVCDEELFFRIVKAAFGKRRKTLLNSLGTSEELGWGKNKTELVLNKSEIDMQRRGETLSLAEFGRLCDVGKD